MKPKKCFCCQDSHEPINKNQNLKRKVKKTNDEKVLSVSVVRLENDIEVKNYIKENNIKTDFYKFICFSANRNVLNSSQKVIYKHPGNKFSDCSKLKTQEVETINSMSCNVTVVDDIKRPDGSVSSNATSDVGLGGSVPNESSGNYVKEKVLKKTNLKRNRSSTKIHVKHSSKNVKRNFISRTSEFSDSIKPESSDNSIGNDVTCGFAGFDDCPPLQTQKSVITESCNTFSVLESSRSDFSMSDETLITDTEKEKDVSSDSLAQEVKITDRKKIKPCPASIKKSKVKTKTGQPVASKSIISLISGVSECPEDKNRPLKNDSNVDNISVKVGLKQKMSPDIEEPLSLITKLTGCQIPASKVKILPLTSCISSINNDESDDNIRLSKDNDNKSSQKDDSLGTLATNGISSNSNEVKDLIEEKNKSKDGNSVKLSTPDRIERVKENVRTVYDVMEYISVVFPSWNLHILPDTNTFCICQVSRGKNGVPNVSKCIELDDNFNGKVHIYGQHCLRFDGVYDSEDAVVALIKDVDAICLKHVP